MRHEFEQLELRISEKDHLIVELSETNVSSQSQMVEAHLRTMIRELESKLSAQQIKMAESAVREADLTKMSRTQLDYITQLQSELKRVDDKIMKLHSSAAALEDMISHQRHPSCVEGLGYDAAKDSGVPSAKFVKEGHMSTEAPAIASTSAAADSVQVSPAPVATVKPSTQTNDRGKGKLTETAQQDDAKAGPSADSVPIKKKSRTRRSQARGKTQQRWNGNQQLNQQAPRNQQHPNWSRPQFFDKAGPPQHPYQQGPRPKWNNGNQYNQGYQQWCQGYGAPQGQGRYYSNNQQYSPMNNQPARKSPNRARGNQQNPPKNKGNQAPTEPKVTSVYVDADGKVLRSDSSIWIVRESIVQAGTSANQQGPN